MGKIIWSPTATSDLYSIFEYHLDRSEKFAHFLLDLLVDSINRLENFPHLGRVVPELNLPNIRELIVQKYRIVYFLRQDGDVEIATIKHSSKPLADTSSLN